MNPLRLLRIHTNALANIANACERLTNETTTQRIKGVDPDKKVGGGGLVCDPTLCSWGSGAL